MKLTERVGLYWDLFWKGRPALEKAIVEGKVVAAEAKKSGIKTAAFWATALASASAVGAQVGGFVPAPWGAIVLASSTALYALSRGLVKRDDPLGGVKPAVSASENWANVIGALGQVALAVGGVTSPETAAILTAIHAASVAMSDSLAKSGAQPEAQK